MYYREMTQPHSTALTNEQILTNAPSVFATAPHNEVSARYGFTPTIQVIDALRAEGWLPVDATQKNVRDQSKRELTKHLIRFRRLADDITVGDSSVELLLTNSHDRSAAFVLHAGIFRMACANGIVIADSTFNKVSVRHNQNAAGEVVEGVYRVVDEVPLIISQVEDMQAINLTPFEQQVFAKTALDYITPENKEGVKTLTSDEQMIKQMLQPKRREDTGSDLWSTYNVVQEKVIKGGLRVLKQNEKGRYQRNTTRKVKSIDKDIKLNKALWEMAMQLKAIKTNAA